MQVTLIGSNSFLGRHIYKYLINENHQVNTLSYRHTDDHHFINKNDVILAISFIIK